MIEVYICEDDPKQLAMLTKQVNEYIMIEAAPMRLKESTSNPQILLAEANNRHHRLYLLDIGLNADLNGLELAQQIRAVDPNCKFVFITTHSEMMFMVFKYQLEVLDYILKDEPVEFRQRLRQVLTLAIERFDQANLTSANYIQFKLDDQVRQVPISDVMYIESSPMQHKLIVHLETGTFEYYGTVKEAEQLHANLYRCHKSVVVNVFKIRLLNKRMRQIELQNGELVPSSLKAIRELAKGL